MNRPHSETDIYPTRYHASDNPGTWAIFAPIDGLYRSCRADSKPIPVDGLHYEGRSVAVYSGEDGYCEILSCPRLGGFVVDCQRDGRGFTRICKTLHGAFSSANAYLDRAALEVTLNACDGPRNGPQSVVLDPKSATALLKKIGGWRETRSPVARIQISDGGFSAECFDRDGEHLGDISYRPTRDGLFISG